MNLSYRWLELYFPPRKIMHEGSQNMKDYMKIYQEWLANPYFDEKTKEELRAIANDENEIKERFYMVSFMFYRKYYIVRDYIWKILKVNL